MRLDTRNLERVQSRIREIQDLIGETTAPRKPAEGSAFAEVLAAVESGKKEEEAKKTKTLLRIASPSFRKSVLKSEKKRSSICCHWPKNTVISPSWTI